MNLLIVEDSADDLALVLSSLKKAGLAPHHKQIMTYGELSEELDRNHWDVIVCDYNLPSFSGPEALKLVRQRDQDVPFILVSGTINDETAVGLIKAGASDYVLKDNLIRLGPAILREIAETKKKKEFQSELQAKEEQLRHAQKMELLGSLAGGIVHDFNNFLALVMMGCEIAQSEVKSDSTVYNLLEHIRLSTDRAAGLTRQLLSFCRRQVVHMVDSDLNECIQSSHLLLQRILPENIEFNIELHASPIFVHMDPTQIDQVLMNLIINAKDAMPNGGKITVRTYLKGEFAGIDVQDTGIGISEELKGKIFQPFFTTKGQDKGTGLGLSTVKTIVDDSNGTIQVFSSPKVGTRFSVHFPLSNRKGASTKPGVEPAPVSPVISETVLLVEDDRGVREMMVEVLERSGYKVLVASSSADATKVVREYSGPIHLMLSDLSLPETNGMELAYLISQVRSETQMLFVTGYYDKEQFESGDPAISARILQKPFSGAGLLDKVREVLSANPAR